jgi:hypothetical protein
MKPNILPCTTPIVFIVFNRPEHTRRIFHRIAKVRPARLLIVADGPRVGRPDEPEICEQVRSIATQVDWPCMVQTNFATTNMGCRNRIVSGLTWAFQQVERAIILEDDTLPDPSFFPFCDEMLDRYEDDRRISMIGGFNVLPGHLDTDDSYYYSHLSHVWGWATWRWSWARYDEHLTHWPALKSSGVMRNLFNQPQQYRFWARIFDQMHAGTGPNTWDYQWAYSNLVHNALSVIPRTNLVENIGFGPDATHTTGQEHSSSFQAKPLSFPLRHPLAMIPRHDLDELDNKISGNSIRSLPQRAIRKLGKSFGKSAKT